MKKIIICLVIIILIIGGYFAYQKYQDYLEEERIKNAIIKIEYVNPLEVEVLSKVYINDLIVSINGKILDNKLINTDVLGEKEIHFNYINEEDIKIPCQFKVNIVDKTPPVIWLNDKYVVDVGYSKDLAESIMCGDNFDDHPRCFINGVYDVQKIGNYKLTYEAIDNSGNMTKKDFTLKVSKPTKSNNNTTSIPFKSLYNEYKNNNTKIGIDVSKWQGNIDYQKVKEAGVEFVFIKIGGQNGIKGEYYIDPKFERNIEGFKNVDIPIGLYFYSYADTKEEAKKQALWIIDKIKDYNIEYPIAFDWENWSSFNKFGVSFNTLTKAAETFVKTLNDKGYQGMLYSSKNYLEKIWLPNDLPTWLAHYTNKTDYEGEFDCWQRTSSAKISGITDNTVDFDICYLKNNNK